MTAPRRRMPASRSSIAPLRPEVETIFTPPSDAPAPDAPAAEEHVRPTLSAVPELKVEAPAASAEVPRFEPSAAAAPAAPAAAPAAAPTSASTPTSASAIDWDEKKVSNLRIRRGLKAQAETAVLVTQKLEGGHRSWAALVETALERELQRLADEFNGGVPFDPNTSEFRTGRPVGS